MQAHTPGQTHPDANAGGPSAAQLALWATAVGFVVLLVWQAFTLPETVPAHIGPGGEVTRWGSRTAHVGSMAAFGAMTVGLFLVLPRAIKHLPPDLVNLPHKEYWLSEENHPRYTRMLADDLAWIGAATIVFMGAMTYNIGRVAVEGPGPDTMFWIAFVLYMAFILGYSLWMTVGPRWKPPAGASDR